MPAANIYSASKIFTGDGWLTEHAIVTENKTIKEILPISSVSDPGKIQHFENCMLVPAFIDLQIYGAGEKLFAVYPEKDSLLRLKKYCNDGGAAWCMPTAASNTYDVFYKCIDAIKDYWQQGEEGILGLHIEGPWINPVKRGAHIESLIHSPSLKQAKQLFEYGKGVIKIITLAPEVCSKEVIALARSYNIIISAGHSNAAYAEAKDAFSNGITTVTHLYNAMSPLQHRAPGLVGAAMDDEKIMASIIPDGHHVDYAAIRIAKKTMGQRLFCITDAVTETREGFYRHTRKGDKYESDNILSGSALTMDMAVQNLVAHTGIEPDEALRMCSLYPAQVIGLQNKLGKIAAGFNSSIAVLNSDLKAVAILSQ